MNLISHFILEKKKVQEIAIENVPEKLIGINKTKLALKLK